MRRAVQRRCTIGGRDLALGAGALIADRRGQPLRGWIEAGVLVIGGGAAAAGIAAANGLNEPESAAEPTRAP